MTFLEISAETVTVAVALMLSWRIVRRGSSHQSHQSHQRRQYGVVSRQWLMQHDAEDRR